MFSKNVYATAIHKAIVRLLKKLYWNKEIVLEKAKNKIYHFKKKTVENWFCQFFDWYLSLTQKSSSRGVFIKSSIYDGAVLQK